MSLYEHFFKVLSLYLEARIQIRIKVKGRIRTRIQRDVDPQHCLTLSYCFFLWVERYRRGLPMSAIVRVGVKPDPTRGPWPWFFMLFQRQHGLHQFQCNNDSIPVPSRLKSSVADPGCLSWILIFPSPIPDLRSASKNLRIFLTQKLLLCSRNFDPGCSSRIRIFFPYRIPDPEHC